MYNRREGWVSLGAGVIVTSVLGASYAYSAYRPVLEELWQSSFMASLPFSVFIALFAFTSILGGRVYMHKGIKVTTLTSMLLVAIGLYLSSLITLIPSPYYLIFTYGILTGLGNGLGYIPVVTMARKWFPDRAGFATGLVILGYGGSALVFAPLKTILIKTYDISITFATVATISAVLGLIAFSLIKDPRPEITSYFASKGTTRRVVLPKRDMEPKESIRTRDFWLIWISFLLTASPGLMLIGHLMSFMKTRGFDPLTSSLAISVFSVFNALGRPPAGWISDKLGKHGRPITMTTFFLVQSILFLGLAFLDLSPIKLFLVIAVAGFFYGSALALYPAITGDFFGLKYLSMNYSLVFIGWGISGLLAPSLGGLLVDITNGYETPLVVFSVFSFIGAVICAYLKHRMSIYIQ